MLTLAADGATTEKCTGSSVDACAVLCGAVARVSVPPGRRRTARVAADPAAAHTIPAAIAVRSATNRLGRSSTSREPLPCSTAPNTAARQAGDTTSSSRSNSTARASAGGIWSRPSSGIPILLQQNLQPIARALHAHLERRHSRTRCLGHLLVRQLLHVFQQKSLALPRLELRERSFDRV